MSGASSVVCAKMTLLAFVSGAFIGCSSGGDDSAPPAPKEPSVSVSSVSYNLKLDSGIPSDRVSALNETIGSIYTMAPIDINANAANQTLAQMMELTDLEPSTLQKWMEDRAQYLVNDNFNIDAHTSIATDPFLYPESDKIPDVVFTLTGSSDISQPASASSQSQTIMLNIGGSTYLEGKIANKLKIVTLTDGTAVRMTSPRVGIIQIGAGMFGFFGKYDIQNITKDFFRAAVLFHESRHSDGNGRSLGFLHDKCVTGDYKGKYACDAAVNGPYTIGAEILRALMETCDERCTEKSMTILQALYIDQGSRLLQDMDLPNASDDTKAGATWDDTPEGSR